MRMPPQKIHEWVEKCATFCVFKRDDNETMVNECGLCFWRYEMGEGYEEDTYGSN